MTPKQITFLVLCTIPIVLGIVGAVWVEKEEDDYVKAKVLKVSIYIYLVFSVIQFAMRGIFYNTFPSA